MSNSELYVEGVYIPSMDGKDVYLAEQCNKEQGYTLLNKNGEYNLKRFKNVLDYSLDLIDLRKVAKRRYRGTGEKLTFKEKGKEYCPKVVNLNFNYGVKEFNKIVTTIDKKQYEVYTKVGYKYENLEFKDCLSYDGEDIVGVICGKNMINEKEVDGFKIEIIEIKDKKTGELRMERVYKYSSSKTHMSVKKVREYVYKNGFHVDGVKYVRFKRSSGSARVGKCLFIDERLYDDMFELAKCGLDVNEGDEIDLASFEAYISLPTSSIIGTIKIEPKNFLIIDDYDSVFKEDAVITKIDDNNRLYTYQDVATISNSIFDGQSLIDVSLMDKYNEKGMVLLRNKFFKSCCFNTNIQKFFKDNGITDIKQLNGFTLAKRIEDVKVITTPSSIKYYKFDKDFNNYFNNIESTFGVVKFDKDTHYFDGELVQSHYQLLNTLQLTKEETKQLLQPSLDYIDAFNTDKEVMKHHIKWKSCDYMPGRMNSKLDIIYMMLNYDSGIENTRIYKEFKEDIRKSFINNMKKGHIYIHGTYATLFGNPYEMLLHSIGQFDGKGYMDVGTIYCNRYKDGEDLLGCRSPHVTISNILLAKNKQYDMIDKYFNLTRNIVCVNAINENILERLSGADFDSDQMIVSNEKLIIDVAKINYDVFKVPTSLVTAKKTKRHYTKEEMADLDTKTSENKIGEIINKSQELNSLLWDKLSRLSKNGERVSASEHFDEIKELFYDICQLDVMSCIEIDKAKKEFAVNNTRELKYICEKYKDELTDLEGKAIRPKFFEFLSKEKGFDKMSAGKKAYIKHNTTMDYLHEILNDRNRCSYDTKETKKLTDCFVTDNYNRGSVNKRQLKNIRESLLSYTNKRKAIWKSESMDYEEKRISVNRLREEMLYDFNKISINESTFYELVKTIDNDNYKEIRNVLFDILFNLDNFYTTDMFKNMKKSEESTKSYEFFGLKLT